MNLLSNEETLKQATKSLHKILNDPTCSETDKKSAKEMFNRIKAGLLGNKEQQIEAMGLEADLALLRFPVTE